MIKFYLIDIFPKLTNNTNKRFTHNKNLLSTQSGIYLALNHMFQNLMMIAITYSSKDAHAC